MTTPAEDLKTLGYQPELERGLNVWQLTAFGLNYMIPLAPAIIFGVIAATSGKTVALPYLLACIAMLFTANSYMIMVRKFPVAGSLYTYVSAAASPHVGFVAGWVLLLDYILIPTVTAVSAVLYLQHYFPGIPYWLLLISYILLTGLMNILGIKLLATAGLWLLVLGELILVASFIIWGNFIVATGNGFSSLLSMSPFSFSSVPALLTATSVAVLSYLGFDAITTLSEEAKNPKRDVPRAILFSVLIGASTMILTGYLGVLASPDIAQQVGDLDWQQTALFYVSKLTGGELFAEIYTAGFVLAMMVFNVVATTAGARLLFGMGRDGVLPSGVFSKINKKFHTPHYNILMIVLIECVLGLMLSIGLIGEMVNFGALVGFCLLNLSVLYMTVRNNHKKTLRTFLYPLLGATTMLVILISMNRMTLVVGCAWLLLGAAYGFVWSKGYEKIPKVFSQTNKAHRNQ